MSALGAVEPSVNVTARIEYAPDVDMVGNVK